MTHGRHDQSEAEADGKSSATFCFIVDDEKGIRSLIARALHDQFVVATEFSNAPATLAALDHRIPDLIFLDVSLARSDAIEVIRGLGARKFAGRVQLMSGRDLELLQEIKRVGERYGLNMLPVLQKPFRAEAVTSVLREAGLARRRGGAAYVPTSTPQVKLIDALGAGWIQLWYQPKIDLRAMQLVGAEGLARVVHPVHGTLPPAAFLAGADAAGLIALTEHVLNLVLSDWEQFHAAGASPLLSVNAPVNALVKLPIASIVRDNRPKSEAWPGLILEVTEDQILRDIELAHEIATQLRIYDIRLAIDDFGAGYSSLARLRDLPFVEIKLDRSFVAGCAADETNSKLCSTVVDLAHRFGCKAVAEGIERPDDLKALVAMGCDVGQGFLLGRPMAKDKLCAMIRERAARKRAS
jgi:EAL domain-containing protein (putative c-di-GMP-specific phosphodiesterase class I)/FixJ family two-component response regulator